ncbi:hypothetical protein G5B38_00255 [Pseudohalocynthiibacter aestuariivivens]|uniref:DUF4034 domain-containing protein n=1 Tax=Roseovarius pelagicus TaxID=2980108 RepID=A0ABY6DDA0_9RHOB|nr:MULTISPECIES: hypothetical protein [Rhodobacterales]QIE44082.1 hypothetical protein G5B38_00255 [Pseudohalocynthiibacter aestuariivivens]UXX84019.1 hypothetical protein N7U68_05020 [Roseovarius pelagicus]
MPLPSPIMTAAQSFFRHTSLPRLSVLSGKVSYMLRSRRPGRTRADRPDLDALSRRIILPSMPITDEEMARAEFQDRGLKLARQELWDQLAEAIHDADAARTATPGGESAALLLSFGARSDVVAMAEDALFEGTAPPSAGIDAFEAILTDAPDDYARAMIVAATHIDIGWAWRHAPDSPLTETPGARAAQFKAHFDRAADLLTRFSGLAENAPSLAATECALLAAQTCTDRNVADDFEDLIDLDPTSPRHMRALGQTLLPNRLGDYKRLELEARRTASRTGDVWGAGAYAWVYLDALALDAGALDLLDTDFFADGLRDILARCPDQHTANLLAAFCAVSMRPQDDTPHATAAIRASVQENLRWILSDHLHELHPLIWTQALHNPGQPSRLPSRRALISEGRQTALRAIASIFADDISDGSSIAFSPAGMYHLPSI